MEIIRSVKEMQYLSRQFREKDRRIAFVPTMGFLHEGHLQLLREGKRRGDILVLSIFVNPTQFGVGEDFEKYPRNLEGDAALASGAGVDVIFSPESREMYPPQYQTYIDLEKVTQNLCGLSRPGHFRGVATVCCKLFNIVAPRVALFGMKDFQQLVVIKRMAADLNLDLEIIGLPTVREKDGLAMSSRNTYLKAEERLAALSLSRSLLAAKSLYDEGERDAARILKVVKDRLETSPLLHLEYAQICDTETLNDLAHLEKEAVLAIAAKIGQTRLIDNHVFGEPLEIAAEGN